MSFRKIYRKIFIIFILALSLNAHSSFAQPACEYSVELSDSFGDGWNGAILTVTVNDVPYDFTIDIGSSGIFSFPVIAGDPIVVNYTSGVFDGEVSYLIFNSEGLIIFGDGPNPTIGEAFSDTAICPTCPTPANVVVDEAGGITADISWDAPGVTGTYFIEYDTVGFTPGTGLLDSTLTNSITLTGLQENTAYEFYVQLVCPMDDLSNVVGPLSFHTIWLIDVGISDILTPVTACGLGLETIGVAIKNYGDDPQSLIPFFYSVNGVPAGVPFPVDGLYTGVISRDSIDEVDFETESSFTEQGPYVIQAWTELEGDSDPSNDTFTYVVTNIDYNQYPYFSNLEDSDGGWQVMDISESPSWEWGQPNGFNLFNAASGVNAWITNLAGGYNNGELSYLISPCYDFSELTADPIITFSVYYSSETNYDGMWFEYSTDGGSTWTKLGALGSGVNWYNFTGGFTNLGDVWAGESNGWLPVEHTLGGLAGEAECRLRFAFDSDGSVNNYDGFGIDDLYVAPPLSNDLSALSATSTGGECGDLEDHVVVTIRNGGGETQTGFDVSYSINNNPPVTENVGSLSIDPDQEATYTFTTPFNSAGAINAFDIQAWTDLDTEQNVLNDSTSFSFMTIVPEPLPWTNDFEDVLIPAEWIVSDFGIGNGHNAPSNVIFDNLYSGDPDYQVQTNAIGPINAGDSLTFDYRYSDYFDGLNGTVLGPNDSLMVFISVDCGNTFFLVHVIDEVTHVTSAEAANVTVDLDGFAGQEIVVRFYAVWGTGDYWLDLDNINIQACPFSFGAQVDIVPESASGAADASISVNPQFGVAPFEYLWDDGSTEFSISGLSPGVYTVTITDANECQEILDVEIIECPADLALATDYASATGEGVNNGSASVIPEGGTGPYTFEWSNGGNGYQIQGVPAGTYAVTVTDLNGCSDIAEVLIDIMVGNQEVEVLQALELYPNPASNETVLDMSFNESVVVRYSIVNSIGQIMAEKTLGAVQHAKETLTLDGFSAGNYYIVIRANDDIHIKKLLVLK